GGERIADCRGAGDAWEGRVADRAGGDDRGLGRTGACVVVARLGGGLADADRLAEVAGDDGVAGAGGTADVGAVGAAAVALAPLVAGAGACRCPAAAGRAERVADRGGARDGRGGGVDDLVDDR